MKPLRTFSLIALITATTFTCALAQKKQKSEAATPQAQPCALAKVPVLRGLSLGMQLLEVKGALEDPSVLDSRISTKNSVGSRALRIEGSELKGDNAEGVDDVNLIFTDNRLSYIKVNFNGGMHWDGAEDFFTRMSETLKLPKPSGDAGERGSNQRNQKYTIECSAFSVTLAYSFGVNPSVIISDTLAQKRVGDRRAQTDEGDVRTIDLTPGMRNPQPQRTPDPTPPDTRLPQPPR